MSQERNQGSTHGLSVYAPSGAQGKPRVYVTCYPEDMDRYGKGLIHDLANMMDCAVFYTEDMSEEMPEDVYELDIQRMNLVVIPVTRRLLLEQSRAMDRDRVFALEHHIPILPIMMETDLYEIYSRADRFGKMQSLDFSEEDKTRVPFETRLEQYLKDVLVDHETMLKVREMFRAYIFLSYRKKDRAYANELIRLIHTDDRNRDIAIWYDEYLTPGEDFDEGIKEALCKSDLFALMVTPHITEAGNYVVVHEYPMAREAGKPILSTEMQETDRGELAKCFADMPEMLDGHDPEAVSDGISALLGDRSPADAEDPERLYLLGLAYFEGIDVEVDRPRGREMILRAAQAGHFMAQKSLRNIYYNENGMSRDYEKAIYWGEKYAESCEKMFTENDPEYLKALMVLSVCLNAGGRYKRCYEIRNKVAVLAEQHLGPEAEETLTAWSNLALSCIDLGDYPRAVALAGRAYETRLRLLGEKHADTLNSLNNYARAVRGSGDIKRAVELYRKAWEGRRALYGADHRDALNSKVNYGVTLEKAGQYEAAERLLSEACDTYLRIYGPDYPSSMWTLSELSLVKECRGDISRSLELEQRAYDLKLRYLGAEHPQTLGSLSHIAWLYRSQGDLKKALALQEKILEIDKRTLGPDYRSTLVSMNNYAQTLKKCGNYKEAAVVQKEVVDICVRKFGEEHPDTLSVMSALASILAEMGEYKQAVALGEKIFAAICRLLGPDHPDTLLELGNLGTYYGHLAEQRRGEQMSSAELKRRSVELKEKAYQGARRILGEKHPFTLTQLDNLAYGCAKLGDYTRAIELQTQSYQLHREIHGPDHAVTLRRLNQLAIYYADQKDYRTAELLSREAYKTQCRTIGENHRWTLTTLSNIGYLLEKQNKMWRARRVYEKVYEACRRAFGESDPDTRAARESIRKLKG